ncbi:glycoside hydrolase family 25 protein [Shimia sp.]|uniref:glycoside hydrolase family 25 protein n=1 Tax=Shimia sp. TaxID=1954381 RepID=UPI003B8D7A47
MRSFVWMMVACSLVFGCGRSAERVATPVDAAAAQEAARVSALARQVVTYPRFGDDDPVEWDRRAPETYPVHGIDVSRWQRSIDWAQARRAGVNFAFLKATEGGDVADPMFDTHRRGAVAAGVPWGAYHYYYFCRSAESQAQWFIRNVPRGAPLPHVLDMEWTPKSRTCRLRPHGRDVRREARKFLDILEAHYGRRPVVYTTVDFYRDTGIGALGGTEFWLRSVADHPQKTYPGAYWMFWQYSGTGRVAGIEGPVDLNVFRGTPEGWVRWRDRLLP